MFSVDAAVFKFQPCDACLDGRGHLIALNFDFLSNWLVDDCSIVATGIDFNG